MIRGTDDYWDDEYVHSLQKALKEAVEWIILETSGSDFERGKYVKKEWIELLPEPLKRELNDLA